MRLIANRPQMVAQALSGHGKIGNDLYAPFDEAFAKSLPQRHQDIEKAKSLLKAAGQEGPHGRPAVDERRPRDERGRAGVRPAGEGRRRHGQRQDPRQRRLLRRPVPEVAVLDRLLGLAQLPLAGGGGQPALVAVQRDALARRTRSSSRSTTRRVVTTDRTKQAAIIQEMQKMEYDTGGYIVWGFSTLLDGYSTKVQGLKQGDKGVLPAQRLRPWLSHDLVRLIVGAGVARRARATPALSRIDRARPRARERDGRPRPAAPAQVPAAARDQRLHPPADPARHPHALLRLGHRLRGDAGAAGRRRPGHPRPDGDAGLAAGAARAAPPRASRSCSSTGTGSAASSTATSATRSPRSSR